MSIVIEVKNVGWIVDHQMIINSDLRNVQLSEAADQESSKSLVCNANLFNIISPFMMDSEFEAAIRRLQSQESTSTGDEPQGHRQRKRKRKRSFNDGEKAAIEYDSLNRQKIKMSYSTLLAAAREKGSLQKSNEAVPSNNNVDARNVAKTTGPSLELRDICEKLRGNDSEFEENTASAPHPDVARLIQRSCKDTMNYKLSTYGTCFKGCNYRDRPLVISIFEENYVLPSLSKFYLSDIKCIENLKEDESYDIVVMDPPWENRSAKRLKSYSMMKNLEFLQLPIPKITKHGSFIFVWVTNKQKEHQFVKEEMFPAWKVQYITQWFWVKVTKFGDMVYDINSHHKKPYEVLIIGRVDHPGEAVEEKDFPKEQTLLSVPCSIHSRKPPLSDIIDKLFPLKTRRLEMFARNLQQGWTSWGNEVLKYQHVNFFEEIEQAV